MKQKKHHRVLSLKEMMDYIFRRDDAGKRHLLERRMQQNPFVDDAMEGLSMLTEKQIQQYLGNINKRINEGITPRRNLYIGVAATIALLIITGLSVILLEWTRQPQLAVEQVHIPGEESLTETTDTIADAYRPIAEPGDAVSDTGDVAIPAEEKTIREEAPTAPQKALTTTKEDIPPLAEEDYFAEMEIAETFADTNIIVFHEEVADIIQETASPIIAVEGASGESLTTGAAAPANIAPSNRNISGTVTDSEGQPLPGVRIFIAGTNQGTITDFNGRFQLEIPRGEDPRIKVSFVGMTSVELLASEINNNQEIMMHEDIVALNEVVVVGYGRRSRRATSSEASIPDRQAQPVGGFESYETYIRSEAILPDTAKVFSLVVRVQFDVNRRGRVTNAQVISPPGAYDQKAIDIIIRGPEWLPALREGREVEESVRMDIEFNSD